MESNQCSTSQDDFIEFISENEEEIEEIQMRLQNQFEITNLGESRKLIDIQIYRKREKDVMKLYQTDFIKALLRKNEMHECNPVNVPLGSDFMNCIKTVEKK